MAPAYERYGDLKADTAEALIELLRPVRERRAELAADPGAVDALLARGAAKATEVAAVTFRGRRTRSDCSRRHEHVPAGGGRRAAPGRRDPARPPRSCRARPRFRGAVVPPLVTPSGAALRGVPRRLLLVASATSSDRHQSLSSSLNVWDSTWYE